MLETKVRVLELQLSEARPFGDPDYIGNCLWRIYRRRLERVAEILPRANVVREIIESVQSADRARVLRDPGFRLSVDLAMTALFVDHRDACPPAVCDALDFVAANLASGERNSLLFPEGSAGLPLAEHYGFIWREDSHDDNPCRRLFKEQFNALLGAAGFSIVQPSQETSRKLQRGARLLTRMLPKLSNASLVHAPLVVLFSHPGGVFSVTNPHMPGVVFLAESAIPDVWKAADLLLHESTHNKDVELESTHRLLAAPQLEDKYDTKVVQPPWRRSYSFDASAWIPKHALTVMHTYVTLACFYGITLATPDEAATESNVATARVLFRDALDRTEYLVDRLLEIKEELGPAGIQMTEWVKSLVRQIDDHPRTTGTILHHIASLYGKDTRLIGKALEIAPRHQNGRGTSEIALDVVQRRIAELVSSDKHLLKTLCDYGAPVRQTFVETQDIENRISASTSSDELSNHWKTLRELISSELAKCSETWETTYVKAVPNNGPKLEERVVEVISKSSPTYEWFANAMASWNNG